jgi:arylsulfatase A-like enzyme
VTDIGSGELHGQSLLGALGPDEDWSREVHYAEYHGDWYGHYSSRMVTDGRWKLAWNLTDLCELYDLEADPLEMKNLFYDKDHREVRKHYLDVLLKEARRLGDAHLNLYMPEVEEQLEGH